MEADKDGDGKLSFEEFTNMVANTVRGRKRPLVFAHLCGLFLVTDCPSSGYREADDTGGPLLALWLPLMTHSRLTLNVYIPPLS
jgi:hypothetical protein